MPTADAECYRGERRHDPLWGPCRLAVPYGGGVPYAVVCGTAVRAKWCVRACAGVPCVRRAAVRKSLTGAAG
ncbi:hypothetical protein TPA0906_45580 [Streptomyces olivaceus]|nr:hypothetical protein TPA0906_45580 [Streptomyces olivaceus]